MRKSTRFFLQIGSRESESLPVLSGHGDHFDLVNLVKQQDTNKLQKAFLVHGEESSMVALKGGLEQEGYNVIIPEKGEVFQLI